MPKNLTGGNRHKKGKNSTHKVKRLITYPDNKETLFGYAINALGDSRFNVKCSDEVDRVGSIRGGLRGVYINPGDLVLIGLRNFGSEVKPGKKEVCDIILKYSLDEISEIRESKLLVYKDSEKPFIHHVDLNKARLNGTNIIQDQNNDDDYEFPTENPNINNRIKSIDSDENSSEKSFNLEDEFDNI